MRISRRKVGTVRRSEVCGVRPSVRAQATTMPTLFITPTSVLTPPSDAGSCVVGGRGGSTPDRIGVPALREARSVSELQHLRSPHERAVCPWIALLELTTCLALACVDPTIDAGEAYHNGTLSGHESLPSTLTPGARVAILITPDSTAPASTFGLGMAQTQECRNCVTLVI